MAFQITEIVDTQSEGVVVQALHQNNPLTVTICGVKNDEIMGKAFQAVIDYDEILEWNVVESFRDDRSGIWQEQDGVHLLGRVHNILDYGDGKTIVDIYIQNGSEFFTVNSDAIEDLSFDANTGLEIVVRNLYIHPAL